MRPPLWKFLAKVVLLVIQIVVLVLVALISPEQLDIWIAALVLPLAAFGGLLAWILFEFRRGNGNGPSAVRLFFMYIGAFAALYLAIVRIPVGVVLATILTIAFVLEAIASELRVQPKPPIPSAGPPQI